MNDAIIRLSKFAKQVKRKKRVVLAELLALQSAQSNQLFVFRNTNKGATSPWYININVLLEAGYLKDTLIISREAKALKEDIDNLEHRITTLEENQ